MTPRAFYYSKEDVKVIRRMHAQYYPIREIAKAINKDPISVAQKARRLNLPKRDLITVRAIGYHGRDVLKFGHSHEQVRLGLKKQHEREVHSAARERSTRQTKAIKQLRINLKAMERNVAIKLAHEQGATLMQIGRVVGMTKQGVSWILSPPKKKLYDPFNR